MEEIDEAIRAAEALLPGERSPDGQEDPRWQAIIRISEFLSTEPEAIWAFVRRWGSYPDDDLSDAIASCLLEHLLEVHFKTYFPQVEQLAHDNAQFARTVVMCWPFGETDQPGNRDRFDALNRELRESHEAG
jgi:hypothetical protein